jgi:hypothetical protein
MKQKKGEGKEKKGAGPGVRFAGSRRITTASQVAENKMNRIGLDQVEMGSIRRG